MKSNGRRQPNWHRRKQSLQLLWVLTIVLLVTACSDEENPPLAQNNPPQSQISGTISIVSENAVDSDINDPNANYLANDVMNPTTAQQIPNPGTVGGYVNTAGSGPSGRSQALGDTDDFYFTHLLVNQVVTVETDPTSNSTLLLNLVDSNGNNQTASNNNGIHTITVTQSADYYIHIQATSGASNYILNVALPVLSANATSVSDDLDVNSDFVPGEIIVRFREDRSIQSQKSATGNVVKKAAELGLTRKKGAAGRSMLMRISDTGKHNLSLNTLKKNTSIAKSVSRLKLKKDTIDTIRDLRQRNDIIEARPNYRRKAFANPLDTYYDLQWHYQMIKLPAAWDISKGNPEVIVAVIDTGVLLSHRDLQGKLVSGYDFISDDANSGDNKPGIDPNPNDVGDNPGNSSFHGTHVAGTIGASTDNNLGVAGVGWNVKVMPLRVLGKDGGTDYDIEQAILFASGLDNDSNTVPAKPADVINLSLGGPARINSVPTAYQLARQNNVIVVAAAGNAGPNLAIPYTSYPAAIDGVVAVGAVDIFKAVTSYSNYGSFLDVTAPGGSFSTPDGNGDGYDDGVLSTSADDSKSPTVDILSFQTGTSMAAPHIAGVAALMKSVYPALTPVQFDNLLANGLLTEDLGAAGRDDKYGHGLIDALKAVTQASELANGTSGVSVPASAAIYPSVLNFGSTQAILPFTISNDGTEAMTITDISHDGDSWLSISESSVDQNQLGDYQAIINRASLTSGQYSATVNVTTTAGNVSMLLYMQVKPGNQIDDVGQQYVTLRNVDNGVTQRVIATKTNNQYQYGFTDIPAGRYRIESSTDLNNDQASCDQNEACGSYPEIGQALTIEILDATTSFPSLDFQTGFRLSPPSGSNSANHSSQRIPLSLQ